MFHVKTNATPLGADRAPRWAVRATLHGVGCLTPRSRPRHPPEGWPCPPLSEQGQRHPTLVEAGARVVSAPRRRLSPVEASRTGGLAGRGWARSKARATVEGRQQE
jgi:hypothetical protein